MIWHKSSSNPPTVGVAILLSLAISAAPLLASAQQYKPPKSGLPDRRVGAGTRGGLSPNSTDVEWSNAIDLQPYAFVPKDSFGYTVSPQPTFLWYVPINSTTATSTSATAEFRLLDVKGEQVLYSQSLKLPATPGIVSLTLPVSQTLDTNKAYLWQFAVVCDPTEVGAIVFVEGIIQRIQPDPMLANQLQRVRPSARPALYAESGIWYDAVTDLANLRCNQPRDIGLSAQWKTLLRSVELDSLVGESLAGYCAEVNTVASPIQPAGGRATSRGTHR